MSARKKNMRKIIKPLLIMVAVIAVLAVAAVAFSLTSYGQQKLSDLGWFGYGGSADDAVVNVDAPVEINGEAVDTSADSQEQVTTVTDDAAAEATQSAASGDTDGAIAIYEEKARQQSDPAAKAQEYLTLALILHGNATGNSELAQQALEYALKAEDLYPSADSAAYLVVMYQGVGNQDKASEYEQLIETRSNE